MEKDSKQIVNILAVDVDEGKATDLLFSIIKNAKNENGVVLGQHEGFSLRGYVNTPGKVTPQLAPESFTDIVLTSVDSNSEYFTEIANYVNFRDDAHVRVLVNESNRDEDAQKINGRSAKSSELVGILDEHVKNVKEFNANFSKSETDGNIPSNKYSELLSALNVDEEDHDRAIDGLEAKVNDTTVITYDNARKYWNSRSNENSRRFKNSLRFQRKVTDFVLSELEKGLNEFQTKENLTGPKENHATLYVLPDKQSNGIGVQFNLIQGSKYAEQCPVQPLVVRDNHAAVSLELTLLSADHAKEALQTLEALYGMVGSFGLLEKLQGYGINVSWRSAKEKIYIDLVYNSLTGSYFATRLRNLNLDSLNLGVFDQFKLFTNVVASDIENFNLDKLIDEVTKTSIEGTGDYYNIRKLFAFLREAAKKFPSTYKKRDWTVISYALLMLSTIETLNFKLNYTSSDVKETVVEILNSTEPNQEDYYNVLCEGLNMQANAMIAQGLEMLKGVKPMIENFFGLLKNLNYDSLNVNLTSHPARLLVRVSVILPGLTELLNKHLFSDN